MSVLNKTSLTDLVVNDVVGEQEVTARRPMQYRPISLVAIRNARTLMLTAGLMFGILTQAHAVDVNTASAQELQKIKGVGVKTAAKIIHERDNHGVYRSYRDLADRVPGMGDKRLAKLKAQGLSIKNPAPRMAKTK